MSDVAVPAARRRPSRRRWLHSVPEMAGPAAKRGAGHSLALGQDARSRSATAVRTLLDSPGLAEASDPVRLAVVVLASRTPSETGVVEIRARELGRWLGLSVSRVRHAVVPGLRRSGVVDVDTLPGEFGEDWGLTCRVLPMWDAQNKVGHPLRLTKPELATLLRLMEALMAPGWAHRDGRVTPAGLLGARTGHGAAMDRLALLLLVLEAGETGRVRLCGGRVDKRYGRPVATLARLLGRSLSQAERVLERLEGAGLVERPRRQTVSGLRQAARLVVPAVAAAHGGRQGSADAADGLVGDPAGTAWPSEDSLASTKPQVSEAREAYGTDEGDLATTASLHADHSSVADVSSEVIDGLGFSGYADLGSSGRPENAYAHEDQAAKASVAASQRAIGGDGPLRGENRGECPGGGLPTEGSGSRSRLTVVDGAGARQQQKRRVADLGDLRVQVALAPVAYLWGQLRGGQQAVAVRAAERALGALSGIVEPKAAPRVLAARLTDRLEEVGGEALVRDPMGWLLGRGLVQRPACPDLRCDDGIRLDTGSDCPTCENIVHTRRALRARLAAGVEAEMQYSDPAARRDEAERRLREETAIEEQRAQIRRARAEREVEQRQQAIARRRALEEDAELARRQAPCADCGLPESAGLCPVCSYRRRTEELVREAVDLAVAVRADLLDAATVDELTQQCEADTRSLLTLACERACGPDADPAWAAFTAPQVAQQIRDERRAAALRRLLGSQEAVAEADAAYEACLRRRGRGAEAAADEAADAAGRRTAEFLLRQRLGELHAARQRATAAPSPADRVSVDAA
ncbi:hypothetical protein ACIQ8G_26725 [Streptomyces sp. NPDC094154]|uniref:hypothetical protein n=1 Tax=Streptomyces sp. NPDC094154 TaxID=3366059 RepID=UPI0037FD293B